MLCRACQSPVVPVESLRHIPVTDANFGDEPIDLKYFDTTIYRCSHCGHYQIPETHAQDHYTNYFEDLESAKTVRENLSSYNKVYVDVVKCRKQAVADLCSYLDTKNRVLDIACGGGFLFSVLENHFQQIIGVDPSHYFHQVAQSHKSKKVTIIQNLFKADLFEENSFDAFVSTQGFEHFDKPLEILKDACTVLSPGGVGWIEVPNGQKIIGEGEYYNVISEHLNYYTPYSLSTMAHLAGFQVLCVRPSFHTNYLELFVKKNKGPVSLQESCDLLNNTILKKTSAYTHIVAWGAGFKARTILPRIQDRLRLQAFVDSMPPYSGKYIPGLPVPIVLPSKEAFCKADLVIIFASYHEREILYALRNQFHYSGDVLLLSGEVLKEGIFRKCQ